jgi:hypothetical protein
MNFFVANWFEMPGPLVFFINFYGIESFENLEQKRRLKRVSKLTGASKLASSTSK